MSSEKSTKSTKVIHLEIAKNDPFDSSNNYYQYRKNNSVAIDLSGKSHLPNIIRKTTSVFSQVVFNDVLLKNYTLESQVQFESNKVTNANFSLKVQKQNEIEKFKPVSLHFSNIPFEKSLYDIREIGLSIFFPLFSSIYDSVSSKKSNKDLNKVLNVGMLSLNKIKAKIDLYSFTDFLKKSTNEYFEFKYSDDEINKHKVLFDSFDLVKYSYFPSNPLYSPSNFQELQNSKLTLDQALNVIENYQKLTSSQNGISIKFSKIEQNFCKNGKNSLNQIPHNLAQNSYYKLKKKLSLCFLLGSLSFGFCENYFLKENNLKDSLINSPYYMLTPIYPEETKDGIEYLINKGIDFYENLVR